MKYIASCSFGKDSVATVILAKEHGEPLDEVVYCEVMFDDDISGEVPEHRDFIYNIAIPKFEEWGIKVVVLRDRRTYISSFMRIIQKGPCTGRHKGFPLCGRCVIQRDCKIPPINKYKRQLAEDTIQYIGYAKDEQERLIRLDGKTRVSLLEKYGIEEDDTFEICRKHGLLSPIYEFTDRGGVSSVLTRRKKNFATYTIITGTCGTAFWSARRSRTRRQNCSTATSGSTKSTPCSKWTTCKCPYLIF